MRRSEVQKDLLRCWELLDLFWTFGLLDFWTFALF